MDSDRISKEESPSTGIDSKNLSEFGNEVQAALEDLLQMDIPDWISPHRGANELYYDDVQAYGPWEYVTPYLSKLKWFSRKYKDQDTFARLYKAEIERNADEARRLLNEKTIRQRLCPILSRGADDLFQVALGIMPVLAAAAFARQLTIPWSPLIVALSALMIARIGIDGFCRGNIQITK